MLDRTIAERCLSGQRDLHDFLLWGILGLCSARRSAAMSIFQLSSKNLERQPRCVVNSPSNRKRPSRARQIFRATLSPTHRFAGAPPNHHLLDVVQLSEELRYSKCGQGWRDSASSAEWSHVHSRLSLGVIGWLNVGADNKFPSFAPPYADRTLQPQL